MCITFFAITFLSLGFSNDTAQPKSPVMALYILAAIDVGKRADNIKWSLIWVVTTVFLEILRHIHSLAGFLHHFWCPRLHPKMTVPYLESSKSD